MDEASLAEQLASALVERLGSQQAGRLIGVADLAPTASVDLSTQARQWREGDIYETGAVATYSGGLWQARNKTASRPPGRIGEWLLLCDGVKTVQGYRRGGDARAFGLIVLMASGETIDLPFDLPIPNHRGHWREHDLYTQGDEVEWNGATYRALHNAPGAPNTDDWRLVSGRGLTGDRGERGERGDTGERGETGDRGLTGPAGERGERGFPGQMGPGIRAIEQVPGYPGIVRAVLDDGTITNPVRVSGMQFVGVYQPGASYQRGDIVRLGFHLFIAVEPTETVPSTNSSDWALFLTGQEPGGAAGGGGGGGGLDIPTADARYLQLIGGSLTGKLATPGTVISDPTGTVATKGYVDGLNLIMDGRVAALDARVTALDARVAALDARVTALENAP